MYSCLMVTKDLENRSVTKDDSTRNFENGSVTDMWLSIAVEKQSYATQMPNVSFLMCNIEVLDVEQR